MAAMPKHQTTDSQELFRAKRLADLVDRELTPIIGEIRRLIGDNGNCHRSDLLFSASMTLSRARAAAQRKVERLEAAA